MAKQIVIMSGGFHPFHAGHMALYKSAIEAFPEADVYVAATNDTKNRPFPFAIKEKLAKLAGVDPSRFVQVKSPFQPREITSQYDPERDQLIFVRSEKDRDESPRPGGFKKDGQPGYLQPYNNHLQPFSKHAYMVYLPTVKFSGGLTSATQIRNNWPNMDHKQKLELIHSLYPITQSNPKLAKNAVGLLDVALVSEPNTDEIKQPKKAAIKKIVDKQLAESLMRRIYEAKNRMQQAAIAISMKKAGKKPKKVNESFDYLEEK
jgi:hypothetical protein